MKPGTRNNLIALTCFGPITLLLLPFGVLLLPGWLSMLSNQIAGNPMNVHFGPDETIWVTIWPIAQLLLGLAGLVGLLRFLSIVNCPHQSHRGKSLTLFLVGCGVLGVTIFNFTGGGIDPFEETTAALVYWILPLIGTLFFLYIGRKELIHSKAPVE